jgi:hypothetical protein
MHIAHIRQQPDKKPRKLTRKQEIMLMVERLDVKWGMRDRANAEKEVKRRFGI